MDTKIKEIEVVLMQLAIMKVSQNNGHVFHVIKEVKLIPETAELVEVVVILKSINYNFTL